MTMKKTCFVVMGFGQKVDLATGRTLNLDATYHNLIKPAIEEAGLECCRADEITHSGNINVPMYRHILTADVVVADVSTANSTPSMNSASAMRCAPRLQSLSRKTSSSSRSISTKSLSGPISTLAKTSA